MKKQPPADLLELYQKVRFAKEKIARRVALELQDGDYVNLGIGIPTMVPLYVPPEREVIFHTENGCLGMGPTPDPGEEDWNLIDAGKRPVTYIPGACFFSQELSHAMARGGHLSASVLGAFQVAENGDFANWTVPGESKKRAPGVGGAMDMARARKLIISMTHVSSNGDYKLLERCSYPLTAVSSTQLVVTDIAVIEVTEKGFLLKEVIPELTHDNVQDLTGAKLIVDQNLGSYQL